MKGKLKNNFIFIVGLSVIAIVLFIVGFVVFYTDSSYAFNGDGYIISSSENSSDSYSFASGTKYKENLYSDIAFKDNGNKSVSVDAGSFVHYDDGSISFLQNGAILSLDSIKNTILDYYNISNKFLINYNDGMYSITNDTKTLSFSKWVGRISDSKYIVVGDNITLKIPGVNKVIEGNYFELLFIKDGIVKIDNEDVSYQVTCQGTSITIDDSIKIDLSDNNIYYGDLAKLSLAQITINGDENIDVDGDEANGSGSGGGDGTGSGSGVVTSGTITSSVEGGDGAGSGSGSGEGTGEDANDGEENPDKGIETNESATIELIKIDVTSTTMYATLQMNNSGLISGSLVAYLTNISTGERESINISKKDGTLAICNSGTDCYSFNSYLIPSNQYLLSIIDSVNNKQYFQKLITTSELGVNIEKDYTTANEISYNIGFNTDSHVSQIDLYLYAASDIYNNGEIIYKAGEEVGKYIGITENNSVVFSSLNPYSSYMAVMKNVSVCDDNNNCSYDENYEISRTDMTLKTAPVISNISVNKNTSSASFDLSGSYVDPYNTISKYIYTVCKNVTSEDEESECFIKEKTDDDALTLKVGEEIDSGIVYTYTLKVQYNDGQMDREVYYNGNKLFSMESLPYFQFGDKVITSNSISGTLSLVDPSCTVPIQGRICRNSSNIFRLRYYKLTEGEEGTIEEITISRTNLNYDESSGLYTYDLKLNNLASETKYVIKIYGTYVLNNEEYNNVQIGDEIYAETSSTGNLKFVYSSNESNDVAVINYNARFSGGNKEDNSEEDTISALGSINEISFDLYAGSYVDDSDTNSRHIGDTFTMTGNSNIRKLLCNTDTNSEACNVTYNFTNSSFGLDNLSALMRATGSLNNFCNNKDSFGCLASTYTVVVTKAVDSSGNAIKIDKDTYTYNITPSYYVTTQLKYHSDKKAISVDKILKSDFINNGEYKFTDIINSVSSEVKDISTYKDNLNKIEDDTVVGIRVNASIPQSYINSAYSYDKVVTNYYICSSGESNCNSDTAIKSISDERTNYSNTSYTFYLNDSNFVRGNTYKVMYELVFTSSDGTLSTYSNSYTVSNVDISRQAPIYKFYITNSTKNSITYGYNITDMDNSINKNDYKFYYKVEDNDYKEGDSFTFGETRYVTFNLCDDTCNESKYGIYLKEKLVVDKSNYVSIDEDIFDGYYSNSSNDKFSLLKYNNDNRLYIRLNDSELSSRTVLYEVKLNDGNDEIFDRVYLSSKMDSCSDILEYTSGVCYEESGNYKYIVVDYADVASSIGKNITVSVNGYYDSGLIGIYQKFDNGLILHGSVNNKYLNIYGSSNSGKKTVIESEDNNSNGIYYIEGSDSFGTGDVVLYNALNINNINNYSNKVGTTFYTGQSSLVDKTYTIGYLNNGIKLGDFSNYNPKVVKVTNINSSNNKFKFDSIIPKISTKENRGINSLDIMFNFSGVTNDTLNSQFKNESDNYYLYVNLYDKDMNKIKSNVKVKIDLDNGTSVMFKDLDVTSTYYYDIYAYLKDGSNYNLIQVFDGNYTKDYINTTYETSTLDASELLSNITFESRPVDYKNNGESISDKSISYNVNVVNGNYLKLRLGLYDKDGKLVNFDGTKCTNENNCYVEISDSSNSIISNDKSLKSYNFNNNDFVFGDGYYTLKVYAIPYYADGGYNYNKMITLYDKVLNNTSSSSENINVSELNEASFSVSNFTSGYNVTDKYFISFNVSRVNDLDYVMKNKEYYITLYDENGEVVYTVKNENGKAVMRNSSNTIISGYIDSNAVLYSSSINVFVKFSNLNSNSRYSIELSYNTYRNNISFIDDTSKKTEVSPYTDYIYTPISEGITLGIVDISKESNTTFKLNYVGSNNLDKIKRVDYKVNLKGSSSSTTGNISGNSIFTKNNSNYSLLFDLTKGSNTSFDFSTKGTYNVSITYYSDVSGLNKVYSSTFSILVS